MNLNSSKNPSLKDSIKSNNNIKYSYEKKNSNKTEEGNFFSIDISKTSQEIKNKYIEGSDKCKTNKNTEKEPSNNNTFELSNNKYYFGSQNSNNIEETPTVKKNYLFLLLKKTFHLLILYILKKFLLKNINIHQY